MEPARSGNKIGLEGMLESSGQEQGRERKFQLESLVGPMQNIPNTSEKQQWIPAIYVVAK